MANIVSLDTIAKANNIIENLRDQLLLANYLPFGQALNNPDHVLVSKSLIAHRIVNKWHRPDNSVTNRLKTECFDSWVSHEQNLWNFEFSKNSMNMWHWKAADNIRTWLRPYKRELGNISTLNDLSIIDLEFTPGETFTSNKGRVSVKQKLMTGEWTVTYNLVDWAVLLIGKHKYLRDCALARLWAHIADPYMQELQTLVIQGEILPDDMFNIAVKVFLLQKVNGARGSSVAKNNSVRRFINIEPLFNVIYQRAVALVVRKALSKQGNDLHDGQTIHRELIRSSVYSTLDLRNASDSNIFIAAEALLHTGCPELWAAVRTGRSYTTILTYPDGHVEEHVNCKLSSMGNGYTFEIMTLILLSQARVVDMQSRVYGDDIIIRSEFAEVYAKHLELTGWCINPSKTFINSSFRESCGGFYHDGRGYLTSYDVEYITNVQELVTVCNKLLKCLNFVWMQEVADAHSAITRLIPALLKGPLRSPLVPNFNKAQGFNVSNRDLNVDYVEVDDCLKVYKRSKDSRDVFGRWKNLWDKLKSCNLVSSQVLGMVKIPRFKSRLASPTSTEVYDPFTLVHYLYSNRVSDDAIRGKGRWTYVTCFILSDGHVIPVAIAKQWIRKFYVANAVGPKPACYHSTYFIKEEQAAAAWWYSVFDKITIIAA